MSVRAEVIYIFIDGIEINEETLAVDLMKQIGHGGSFLATHHTQKWFRKEQYLNVQVFNRQDRQMWVQDGAKDSWVKAQEVVESILAEHTPESLPSDVQVELDAVMQRIAERMGGGTLPKARYW